MYCANTISKIEEKKEEKKFWIVIIQVTNIGKRRERERKKKKKKTVSFKEKIYLKNSILRKLPILAPSVQLLNNLKDKKFIPPPFLSNFFGAATLQMIFFFFFFFYFGNEIARVQFFFSSPLSYFGTCIQESQDHTGMGRTKKIYHTSH